MIIEFMGTDINLIDVDYSPGCRAKINCPVEESYPEESPEISFQIDTGFKQFDDFLEDNFWDLIEEAVIEKIEEEKRDALDEVSYMAYEDKMEGRYLWIRKN